MNILKHPGFEYGYPASATTAWYGLWNPNCDCFVWLDSDLDKIKLIQMLCSSKSITYLLQLDPELYKNNVIDNECCTGWTVEDLDFSFNEIYKNFRNIPLRSIIKKSHVDPKAQALVDWILFLNQWILCVRDQENRFENFLSDVLDINHDRKIKQIYQILLLEDDQTQAEEKLLQVIGDV